MRVLIIRRDNIGDLVCATPLIEALRARHPDAHIAALVNSYNAGVLEGNPHIDAVHVYTKAKHRQPGESWLGTMLRSHRLLVSLRQPAFDHVILAKSDFDPRGLELARHMRPRDIIGFARRDGRPEKGLGTTLPPPANNELHETEAILRLGAPLGVTGTPGPVHVYPAPERVASWRARLPAGPRHWVALHISARQARRHWPTERFVELARTLSRDAGVGIALLYSPGPADDPRHPGDDERAAAIVSAMGSEVTLLPARTESLADLIAVLSLCHSFIGPDGGAMHIAAGVGLPIVALFENLPEKKKHWSPWHVPHVMVSPPGLDVVDLPVAAVADAWKELMARLPQ
jgi:ADP-heptose:LPS heptosyltransferase